MADVAMPLPPARGLSEVERVVDTFVAPSKTFEDIRRKATWWLPWLLLALSAIPFTMGIDKNVGFPTVAEHQMHQNKFAAERIDALPADQKASMVQKSAARTRVISYAAGVPIIVFALVVSLLWWVTTNFVLGARTRYWQMMAIWMYAALPKILLYVISAVLLFAGVGTDNFDMQNPAGTNLGYYISADHPVLRAAGSFLDVFGLWALLLAVLGISIVAGKTKTQAACVVFGWWVLGLLLTTAMAAAFS